MLEIHCDQVFTIGIVNGTKQPIAAAPNLRNLPTEPIFSFEPGGYFGVYHPETFWYDDAPTPPSAERNDVRANPASSRQNRSASAPPKAPRKTPAGED